MFLQISVKTETLENLIPGSEYFHKILGKKNLSKNLSLDSSRNGLLRNLWQDASKFWKSKII